MGTTHQRLGLQSLDVVTLVVDDVNGALTFYTDTLGFEKRSDDTFDMEGSTGRWVTIGLPGDAVRISLTSPDEPYYDAETREQLASKRGVQTWWTFRTDDCEGTAEAFAEKGVEITRDPETYPWGTEAMFADPFGNEFSLFEQAEE